MTTSNQKNIPALRFKEFDGEWEKDEISNLFIIKVGGTINKENVSSFKNKEFPYPIYANAEKKKGLYGYSNIYKFEGGAVTIAGRGNIGIAHARNHAFFPIVRLLVLIPKKDADIYFYEYAFNNLNFFIEGTGVPQLTSRQLSTRKVFFPSLPEQQKIARFLTAIDQKINQLSQKVQLQERYKKGVMQKLFSQELRFKDADGKDFADWEVKRLGEVFSERNEKEPKSRRYPLMSFIAKKGVVPKGDRYNREFLVKNTDSKKYKKTEYGDFIYSSNNLETGSIGVNRYGSASISPVYSIFKIAKSCDCLFIHGFCTRKKFIHKMVRYRQGVVYGQWRIHESNFLKIEEAFPSLPEQQKIAHFLSQLDEQIERTRQQLAHLQDYKKGLLQQLFV